MLTHGSTLRTPGKLVIRCTSKAPKRYGFVFLRRRSPRGITGKPPVEFHAGGEVACITGGVICTTTSILCLPSADQTPLPMASLRRSKYRSYLRRSCLIEPMPCWQFISTRTIAQGASEASCSLSTHGRDCRARPIMMCSTSGGRRTGEKVCDSSVGSCGGCRWWSGDGR